jgi:hypothetical protein
MHNSIINFKTQKFQKIQLILSKNNKIQKFPNNIKTSELKKEKKFKKYLFFSFFLQNLKSSCFHISLRTSEKQDFPTDVNSCVDTFSYITQFFPSSYAKVIAIFNSGQPFFL